MRLVRAMETNTQEEEEEEPFTEIGKKTEFYANNNCKVLSA